MATTVYATTDANGNATFENLEPGATYYVGPTGTTSGTMLGSFTTPAVSGSDQPITATETQWADLANKVKAKQDTVSAGTGISIANNVITNRSSLTFYGTCSTAAGTAAKVVTCANFTANDLVAGTRLVVYMTNANSFNGTSTLNVNSTGAKNICYNGSTTNARYMWVAGESVEFVYNGSQWATVNGGLATTSYYGVTKLNDSDSSDSTAMALVPNALYTTANQTICPYYSASSTYAVGDTVRYSKKLYRCNTAITTAEAWTAAHWTELPTLQEQIDSIEVGGAQWMIVDMTWNNSSSAFTWTSDYTFSELKARPWSIILGANGDYLPVHPISSLSETNTLVVKITEPGGYNYGIGQNINFYLVLNSDGTGGPFYNDYYSNGYFTTETILVGYISDNQGIVGQTIPLPIFLAESMVNYSSFDTGANFMLLVNSWAIDGDEYQVKQTYCKIEEINTVYDISGSSTVLEYVDASFVYDDSIYYLRIPTFSEQDASVTATIVQGPPANTADMIVTLTEDSSGDSQLPYDTYTWSSTSSLADLVADPRSIVVHTVVSGASMYYRPSQAFAITGNQGYIELLFTGLSKNDTNSVVMHAVVLELADDSAIWAEQSMGGGGSYTAGDNITITNNVIDTAATVPLIGSTLSSASSAYVNTQNIVDQAVTPAKLASAVMDMIYPVGSIYMSATLSTAAQVEAIFGGTWVAWGAGRVPLGVGNNGTTNYTTVEATGGEETVTLTSGQTPKRDFYVGHISNADNNFGAISGVTASRYATSGTYRSQGAYLDSTASAWRFTFGNNEPHNNIQPYITCYMYKRTA